jgi:ArsR family transcriptional regulator
MKTPVALKRLSALSQASRLKVFRLLVNAGPDGMAAGRIARKLGIAANTMSAQLQILSTAGLVVARRDGRSILYAADFDAMNDLLVFLTKDCCGDRLEKCPPLAGTVAQFSAPTKKPCC